MTKSLARKIAGRFVLRDKLQSNITIHLIENEDNYVSLKEVFLCLMTKSKLHDLLENGDISEVQYKKFIVGAIEFYKVSLKYILEKMNVEALFWKHAVWADFEERANANWSDCEFFSLKFANVLGFHEEKLELLYEQFHEYKTINDAKLPDEAYEEGASDGNKKEYRADVYGTIYRKCEVLLGLIIGLNYCLKLHELF